MLQNKEVGEIQRDSTDGKLPRGMF